MTGSHAWIRSISRYRCPDNFQWPEDSPRSQLIEHVVLPACRDHGLPFAMMIGVRRARQSGARATRATALDRPTCQPSTGSAVCIRTTAFS